MSTPKRPVGRPRHYASNAERQRAYRQRQAQLQDEEARREDFAMRSWLRHSDCYAVLGVRPHAETEAIEGAYKALVRKYHPDRHAGDPRMDEQMKIINRAYDEIQRRRGRT